MFPILSNATERASSSSGPPLGDAPYGVGQADAQGISDAAKAAKREVVFGSLDASQIRSVQPASEG